MAKVRARGEEIRRFILDNVDQHSTDIAKVAADQFGITRQGINKHIKRLVEEESLTVEGKTRGKIYRLRPLLEWSRSYRIIDGLEEDVVWRGDIEPRLGTIPDNVRDIWHYCFTEMFNNAIDHSSGSRILAQMSVSARDTKVALYDDGIGIFRKIQQELDLLDERHAVLELAKGKLTTDPERHSGEGIFFTSRLLDAFEILSGGVYFSHKFGEKEDWIFERNKFQSETAVWMRLNNHTARTSEKIFKAFTSAEDDYGFTKTVVPVRLAQYGEDKLISRSQAKRLTRRFEKFKVVILDFAGVDSIGQAFADEIFRVFQNRFPDIELSEINARAEVMQMIDRARNKI